MRAIKGWMAIVMLMFSSCIQEYMLNDEINFEQNIVVDAMLSNLPEDQVIKLSVSSNPVDPKFEPLTGCQVWVNSQNNSYLFTEYEKGSYAGSIDQSEFYVGNTFYMEFTAPDDKKYISQQETIKESPKIDKLHYKIDEEFTELDAVNPERGVRFYLDVTFNNKEENYAKWQISETYEYHSAYPITYVYEGRGIERREPDFSLSVCYRTERNNQVFLFSSKNTNAPFLNDIPLNFVDNTTQKLRHKYILTLKQYSLTSGAYNYWSKLVENNQESGGINDGQPVNVRGNIAQVDNQENILLGYFSVGLSTSKRLYLEDIPDLEFPPMYNCVLKKARLGDLGKTTESDWPLYFTMMPETDELGTASKSCYDCTIRGGSTYKPDFWDEE